jgi:hypothetical protein
MNYCRVLRKGAGIVFGGSVFHVGVLGTNVVFRSEVVKKLGQAPWRPLIFQGFRRFGSEPVPFFHSLSAKARTFAERKTTLSVVVAKRVLQPLLDVCKIGCRHLERLAELHA